MGVSTNKRGRGARRGVQKSWRPVVGACRGVHDSLHDRGWVSWTALGVPTTPPPCSPRQGGCRGARRGVQGVLLMPNTGNFVSK